MEKTFQFRKSVIKSGKVYENYKNCLKGSFKDNYTLFTQTVYFLSQNIKKKERTVEKFLF